LAPRTGFARVESIARHRSRSTVELAQALKPKAARIEEIRKQRVETRENAATYQIIFAPN
jgi:hypothetical protein